MPTRPTGTTVPRRQLGRHLRELRGKARLTVKAAAEAMEWSETTIWRIENGHTSVRGHDVELMCRIYGAPIKLTEGLVGLAKETKNGKSWWHAYGDVIPESFDLYIGLEETAERLSSYQSERVPGLVQTEDYARTLIRADNPSESDEEIERRVQVRVQRQALLTRIVEPPQINFVLHEAVLRPAIGSNEIMAGQLAHLAEVNRLPNVSVRVIPFVHGLHPGIMSGQFVMMHFPANGDGRPSEPTTIYVEGFTGALYLEKPEEVERYQAAFTSTWNAALSEADSTSFLHQAAKGFQRE
ncbi:helix-turn-helix domain-containing protein [Actinomadura formosensis]|uniref:helix-turn-helix domain-containing protein n=1 Tax=Actinomadura formosensis TaxID=60706 RepID=UPI00082F6EFE|nr:helix-turn-helix transcriptional regulator [Actinomadura formosensis]